MKGGRQKTKYREILRLLSNQLKTDEIAHACNVSKKTVIKVKKPTLSCPPSSAISSITIYMIYHYILNYFV